MMKIPGGKDTVERRRIPELFTPQYFALLDIWQNYKAHGLPFDYGWADHPYWLIKMFRMFDEEVGKCQRQK